MVLIDSDDILFTFQRVLDDPKIGGMTKKVTREYMNFIETMVELKITEEFEDYKRGY